MLEQPTCARNLLFMLYAKTAYICQTIGNLSDTKYSRFQLHALAFPNSLA
jgi:hypothetical protein